MKNVLIVCSKNWFFENTEVKKFIKKKNVKIINSKKKLNIKYLKYVNPSIIFFPHWSYKVSKRIIQKYNCICFHTGPLPQGRGGSTIQNLIMINKKNSTVCALKMTENIDAGPIFLKKKISLKGNLEEIFKSISNAIINMMKKLINKKIIPKKQKGKISYFKRLNKKNSKINSEISIKKIYDKIRMLDSPEYPKAYFKIKNLKIELDASRIKKNYIFCNAKIFKERKN